MSRFLMTKLDIDVLVQLALVGPSEATEWKPLTDDPDRLGTGLASRNYEAAADPEIDGPLPSYTFAPLPITITATEGLRHIQCYHYQTATDEPSWTWGGVGAFLQRLGAALVDALPGMDDAPWGWDARALEARADRPRPRLESDEDEALEDPRITAWSSQWTSIGLPLTRMDPQQAQYSAVPDPRDLLASGYYRPRGQTGFAPVTVTLLDTASAAEDYFIDRVRDRQRARHLDTHVYRWDSTVAVTSFSPDHEAHFIPAVDQSVAELGDPDQHWWSFAPPLRRLEAEVVATHVRLNPATAGTHSDSRALYARTPKELAALAALLEDAGLQEQVASINTRKQTVVLMRGVCEIAAVNTVEIEQEVFEVSGRATLEHSMYIATEGATSAVATLLVMDRLTQTPASAIIRDPALSLAMIGDTARTRG